MKKVRVGAGQGFYGDTIDGALANARYGNLDYLAFDSLAELTMAILTKDKMRDESKGYAKDIPLTMKALLPYVKDKGLKVLTNGGGINPLAARDKVVEVAQSLGYEGLKIAVVTGDDMLPRLEELQADKVDLTDLETGEDFSTVQEKIMFANAYVGAQPIVKALREGADIVITGRTTDTAQFLAPLIYEFGWKEDEWDKLASGIFMGHLLECSAQSTGGNFSGDWEDIEGFDEMGYPIAEVEESGDFIITKAEERGGLVSVDTVREQTLYEIHDPSAYITPDVIVDLTALTLEQAGHNVVQVTGVKGKPRPDTLKAVMGYHNGYMSQVMVGYSWPKALKKAEKADQIIRSQIKKSGQEFDEIRTDYIGYNSLHGPLATEPSDDINEIYLRMAVKGDDKRQVGGFSRFFPPLALNGPPSLGGFVGNTRPRELIGMWSSLIPREVIEDHVKTEVQEVKLNG